MARLTAEQERVAARRRRAIAKRVRENPFEYLTSLEARMLFNFGEKSWSAMVELGLPVVSQRVLPSHVSQWLWDHRDDLGKLTTKADD